MYTRALQSVIIFGAIGKTIGGFAIINFQQIYHYLLLIQFNVHARSSMIVERHHITVDKGYRFQNARYCLALRS
jgi:hypothetical protein